MATDIAPYQPLVRSSITRFDVPSDSGHQRSTNHRVSFAVRFRYRMSTSSCFSSCFELLRYSIASLDASMFECASLETIQQVRSPSDFFTDVEFRVKTLFCAALRSVGLGCGVRHWAAWWRKSHIDYVAYSQWPDRSVHTGEASPRRRLSLVHASSAYITGFTCTDARA